MDIEMIKSAKRQCESEIRAILAMFENQSGCIVHDVGVLRSHNIGGSSDIINITIDARINY